MFGNIKEVEKYVRKKFSELGKKVELRINETPDGKLVVDFKFPHIVDECVGWCRKSLDTSEADCREMCEFEVISSFVVASDGTVEDSDIAYPFTRTERCIFAEDKTRCEVEAPWAPLRSTHFHMNSVHKHLKCPTVDDLFDYIAACLG